MGVPAHGHVARASRHSKSSPTPCKLLVFVASFRTFEIDAVILEKNLQRLKEVGERVVKFKDVVRASHKKYHLSRGDGGESKVVLKEVWKIQRSDDAGPAQPLGRHIIPAHGLVVPFWRNRTPE